MKILINESQIAMLVEYIHPSEAHGTVDAVRTLCDGKRGVAMVSTSPKVMSSSDFEKVMEMVSDCDLNSIHIPSNEFDSYFVFVGGYEQQAKRLLQIAEKYGGYLAYNASEEDTREIGELLEYEPEEVEKFIRNGNKV